MKRPSPAELQLIGLVVLLAWPMQLHAKHIPPADPLGISGFAAIAYLAWPLASIALLYGTRRGVAAAWLTVFGAVTATLVAIDGYRSAPQLLFGVGVVGLVSAALVARAGEIDPSGFGLGPGEWRRWGPLAAIGVGVAVLLVQLGSWLSPELVSFYPVHEPARHSLRSFVGWELAMVAYMVCWEAMFRGLMLFASRRALSDTGAVLLQAIPFFLLHANKPELEMATSIVGGIFLGGFCLWARSCWPAAIWHATLYTTMEATGALSRL